MAKELMGLLLLLWSIIVLVSLLSFSELDPGMNHAVAQGQVQNFMGLSGAYLSSGLVDFFGIGSYVWVLFFVAIAGRLTFWSAPLQWWRWLGLTFLFIASAWGGAQFGWNISNVQGGGLLGEGFHTFIYHVLGSFGGYLLWFFFAICTLQLLFNFSSTHVSLLSYKNIQKFLVFIATQTKNKNKPAPKNILTQSSQTSVLNKLTAVFTRKKPTANVLKETTPLPWKTLKETTSVPSLTDETLPEDILQNSQIPEKDTENTESQPEEKSIYDGIFDQASKVQQPATFPEFTASEEEMQLLFSDIHTAHLLNQQATSATPTLEKNIEQSQIQVEAGAVSVATPTVLTAGKNEKFASIEKTEGIETEQDISELLQPLNGKQEPVGTSTVSADGKKVVHYDLREFDREYSDSSSSTLTIAQPSVETGASTEKESFPKSMFQSFKNFFVKDKQPPVIEDSFEQIEARLHQKPDSLKSEEEHFQVLLKAGQLLQAIKTTQKRHFLLVMLPVQEAPVSTVPDWFHAKPQETHPSSSAPSIATPLSNQASQPLSPIVPLIPIVVPIPPVQPVVAPAQPVTVSEPVAQKPIEIINNITTIVQPVIAYDSLHKREEPLVVTNTATNTFAHSTENTHFEPIQQTAQHNTVVVDQMSPVIQPIIDVSRQEPQPFEARPSFGISPAFDGSSSGQPEPVKHFVTESENYEPVKQTASNSDVRETNQAHVFAQPLTPAPFTFEETQKELQIKPLEPEETEDEAQLQQSHQSHQLQSHSEVPPYQPPVVAEPVVPTYVQQPVQQIYTPTAFVEPAQRNIPVVVLPSLDLLNTVAGSEEPVAHHILDDKALRIIQCLADFGIKGELIKVVPGPVVTNFEFKPAPGVRVNKIAALADDLALALMAVSVRIQTPIPGTDVVGIEIPNDERELVGFKELLEAPAFTDADNLLTLALGKDTSGESRVADLAKMPHLLVAGATGTGKSVCLNSILLSILYKARPDQVRLLLIDPKRIELAIYADLPHLVHPVVTEMHLAKNALDWAVQEMDVRFEAMKRLAVRNIASYNEKLANYGDNKPDTVADLEPFPYLVILIDELADLMLTAAKEVETSIVRLAQLARAAGIHLIIATQRPSVDVVTGLIKANFPCRISFQVTSRHDSRTILDANGAERLLGKGDMLYKPNGGRIERMHGAFVSDEEVVAVVDYWKQQLPTQYLIDFEEIANSGTANSLDDQRAAELLDDPIYNEAVEFVLSQGKASISQLQRRFRIGFNKAARYVEQMESDGIIGPADGSRPRAVLR